MDYSCITVQMAAAAANPDLSLPVHSSSNTTPDSNDTANDDDFLNPSSSSSSQAERLYSALLLKVKNRHDQNYVVTTAAKPTRPVADPGKSRTRADSGPSSSGNGIGGGRPRSGRPSCWKASTRTCMRGRPTRTFGSEVMGLLRRRRLSETWTSRSARAFRLCGNGSRRMATLARWCCAVGCTRGRRRMERRSGRCSATRPRRGGRDQVGKVTSTGFTDGQRPVLCGWPFIG